MERNENIISTWEVATMDERMMESNFMRLAHCVTYGTCRDWLSSENTGLRSPWRYSKCDGLFGIRPRFKRYSARKPVDFYIVGDNYFFLDIVEDAVWVFMQDYCDYFMNNTIWGMYGLIIGICASTGAVMGTNRKYKYNRRV